MHPHEGEGSKVKRILVICVPQEEEERSGVKPATNQLVLNEVVIDRGPSPYLSNIDLYLDGKLITSVQVFLGSAIQISLSELGRRFDCFYPDGKHGLCSGCWSKHDPPQCTCCYGHPHLSTLLIIQVFVAGPLFLCSDFHPLAHEFAGQ